MDQGLKQRIIGALVLIVAAVVFLPMLLSGQDETVTVEIDAPPAPQMDEREIDVAAPVELPQPEQVPDLPPTPLPDPQPIPLPEPTEPSEPPEPAVAVAPTPPAADAVPPAPAEPASAQPERAASAPSGDWVVQLGSFSSSANAEGLRETLLTQGYNAYTQSSSVDGQSVTRVFVGPVIDRAGANRLRDELARRHGSKGMVVAYDADNRAQ
ncbi:SPOR domain-containing protein [Pseudomonas sp. gcc21]|uniref:SPOR domain-containing protein n=1 Tax=Pseudomonas sp. gcc21 TaxID=2726989 RepID=UPI001451BD82|nr:SPOR domain-containing protein [Pseudomonas sp. gcc21]QJD58103.1 SPOR domain-containing protein [Pseudomonas sp. gcc21]